MNHETSEKLFDEAARWIARLRNDDVSQSDFIKFSNWITGSEAHKHAYDDVYALWDNLAVISRLAFDDLIEMKSPQPDITSPQLVQTKSPQPEQVKSPQPDITSPQLVQTKSPQPEQVKSPQPEQVKSSPGWQILSFFSPQWSAAVASIALIAAGALVWSLVRPTAYSTAVGEQKTVLLEDGSTLYLNTNSRVTVNITSEFRSIELIKGEAYFDVKKDTERPFEVNACKSTTRALGTAFIVFCENGRAKITVTEGSVHLSAGSRQQVLVAAQQISFDQNLEFSLPAEVDIESATAWQRQLLVYDGVPLSQVIEDMNRYSHQKIRIDDPQLAATEVIARFKMADRDSTLASFEEAFRLRVVLLSDDQILLMKTD